MGEIVTIFTLGSIIGGGLIIGTQFAYQEIADLVRELRGNVNQKKNDEKFDENYLVGDKNPMNNLPLTTGEKIFPNK